MKFKRLASVLLITAMLSVLFCFGVNAAPTRMEQLLGTPFYYREMSDGTVTFMRCGVVAEGDVEIPAEINGKPVTRVEEFAFQNCTAVKSVIIPSTVTFIGWGAFNGCTAMESIFIPASVREIEYGAFYNCSSLKAAYVEDLTAWCQIDLDGEYSNPAHITGKLTFTNGDVSDLKIPSNVARIGRYTFYNCKDVQSVTFSEGITEVGECAFYGCSLSGKITMPTSVESIGERAFYGTEIDGIIIPEGNATYKNSGSGVIDVAQKTLIIGFDDTVIPDDGSVTKLGGFAYSGCDKMTSITVPDCVTVMAAGVFENCSALTSVTLPSSITYLNARTFAGCSSLTTVAIPEAVERIGISAFRDCKLLNSITLHDGITEVKDFAFTNCASLTSLIFPSTIEDLGKGITSGCTSLTELKIAYGGPYRSINNCIYSGGMLVAGCKASVIPSDGSVTRIENYTFKDLTVLESIYLPKDVVNIGEQAFDGCDALKTVNYGGDEDAWKAVKITIDNEPLQNAEIKYNSKAPAGAAVGGADGDGSNTENSSDSLPWIWIAVGVAAAVLIAGVAVLLAVKAKKKAKQ